MGSHGGETRTKEQNPAEIDPRFVPVVEAFTKNVAPWPSQVTTLSWKQRICYRQSDI